MSNRPIYAELADELVRDISAGQYPVGSLLPPEVEIAEARGLSRATVRAALGRLVQLGLVTRQKGVGTRVASLEPGGYNPSTTSIEELGHFGAATRRHLLGVESVVLDEAQALRLGVGPGTRWFRVETLRSDTSGDAPPICHTENFVDSGLPDVVHDIGEYSELIATRIASRYGLATDEVRQTIRPSVLPPHLCDLLQTQPGELALEIRRQYCSAGKIIYVSVSQHPADRFEYRMSLRRNGG
ncbi:GntR family transcriptional regulator [Salipiger thiooxidans]|uniref:GntR family transcriptional regulator n=1 Tax=Salipiger thiooxidans TaxID=282683 RepID=UPI001CD81896|nr:GntR family transcriptional regulator [Salipiger thiooxidans]MCA0850604.1 GntR family transcriptional regulator [Salipiger thiooxidans]